MKIVNESDITEIANSLNSGGIVVLRTDTIYGVVTRANDEKACDTIFAIKQRNTDKACIVLLADGDQMWDAASGEAFNAIQKKIDDPVPSSLIVPIGERTPAWIHHGNQDVAFRMPHTKPWLIELLKQTGPLIAPSANLQGEPPARSIHEAMNYFGSAVDVYVDGGEVEVDEPSHLYRLNQDKIERLR